MFCILLISNGMCSTLMQLREVGRKFRSLNDNSKKDCEKLKEQLKEKEERISSLENLEKENEELKKKIEEAPAQSAAPASSEQEERIKVSHYYQGGGPMAWGEIHVHV